MPEIVPLLLLSDGPNSGTGLARITKDLALRIHENLSDIFRVATAGINGPTSRKLPFHQYRLEGVDGDWICPTLIDAWDDFAGNGKGILLTIMDASRLDWFSQPVASGKLEVNTGLRDWLKKAPFKRYGYFPIDGSGPSDRLTFPLMKTLLGFDRILAYGPFGEGVIRRTIGDEQSATRGLTNLPHGIDCEIFKPYERLITREYFREITGARWLREGEATPPIKFDETVIAVVSTNQCRKDFGLGLEACAILSQTRKIRIWIHTDELERHFSIPSLLIDFGLLDKALISLGRLPDQKLAEAYSASDVLLGIGAEGFGLPLIEAQACGCPVLTGSYAGGGDIVPKEMQVEPIALRFDGVFSTVRPVYSSAQWATKANEWIGKRVSLDPQYDWVNLWPRFEAWFREGVEYRGATK